MAVALASVLSQATIVTGCLIDLRTAQHSSINSFASLTALAVARLQLSSANFRVTIFVSTVVTTK